jgi:hypothetical protein
MYSGKIAVPPIGGGLSTSRREILLLGSVRESIVTPTKTSSEKTNLHWASCIRFIKIVNV